MYGTCTVVYNYTVNGTSKARTYSYYCTTSYGFRYLYLVRTYANPICGRTCTPPYTPPYASYS